MNTKNKILIISFVFISYINISNAGYYYPYVCNYNTCYSTEEGEIKKDDNKYFLTNENILKDTSLNQILNEKLNDYKNYYQDSEFTIKNQYIEEKKCITEQKNENICENIVKLEDKKETFSGLINNKNRIIIGKKTWNGEITIDREYENGYDYLYSNFSDIINELHIGFPVGDKKNRLEDLFGNIVSYNYSDKTFDVKNVCRENNLCEKSEYVKLKYNSTNIYSFLSGDIKPASDFVLETFKVSGYKIDDYFMKAGNSLNVTFGFQDYLDIGAENTQYKYTISYSFEGGEIIDSVTETIKISKDFNLSSDTIKNEVIPTIFTLNIIDSKRKKIELNIKEGFNFTKSGKVTFYLSVENLNTGDKFERTIINETVKVLVLPKDEIGSHNAIIQGFSETNNKNGYNINDTFGISISLKDIYGNNHYDNIDGYELSLTEGTSDSIEVSHQGSDVWSKSLTGLTSISPEENTINFKIRLTKEGYLDFKGFNIKLKEKINNYLYKSPTNYITYNGIIPNGLYNSEGQLLKFHVKSSTISDFPINCTNDKIIIKTTCTEDDFSGCNNSGNESIIFNSEDDNGKSGTLKIIDNAYNQRSFNYSINHIDKTAPTIQVSKGTNILNDSYYSYKANNDDLNIDLYEWTTSNCSAEIDLIIKINGIIEANEKIIASNKSYKINDFFKLSEKNKILYIKATDKYGNSNEKTIKFNIYPDDIDPSKSFVNSDSTGDKFANNNDYYTYTLSLRDKFNNPIYGKKLNSINQDDCNLLTGGCKTLKTNMTNNSGDDAIIEFDFGGISDNNGKITFKVKSIAPGEFNNRFKISINKWDDNYSNLSEEIGEYYIGTYDNINSFKKPFVGELLVSKDGINYLNKNNPNLKDILQIGTTLSYKLKITNKDGFLNTITPTISNFKSYIKVTDSSNTKLQNLTDINNLNSRSPIFGLRINTSESATSLGHPGIQIENSGKSPIYISYNLGGKDVSYYLGSEIDNYNNTDIIDIKSNINIEDIKNEGGDTFIGVKVVGNLQGEGKQEITGQESNFSDLSKFNIRKKIRSNAYKYISSMKNGEIVGGVKYVLGDISISGSDLGFETLVVKNGNVIIDGNLTQPKLGIIVLKDNYNVNTDYNNKGNVYIKPNVTQINAIIYADGGVISADNSGKPYVFDSTDRTSNLQNQLIINGALFTRNTIGGAILAGGKYILPGGSKINDFDKAMIYDINYLRTGNKGCNDINGDGDCNDNGEYKDATVIKYNPKIQANPPKLFNN